MHNCDKITKADFISLFTWPHVLIEQDLNIPERLDDSQVCRERFDKRVEKQNSLQSKLLILNLKKSGDIG